MDETGQPNTEPARVNGAGTAGGALPNHPAAWQLADESSPKLEPNSPRPESTSSRLDVVRSASAVRTADPTWSGRSARDQAATPFGVPWGAPVATEQRGRPDPYPYPQYDMLAPVSPAVSASATSPPYDPDAYDFPPYETVGYEGDLEPVPGEEDGERWSAAWMASERAPAPIEQIPAGQGGAAAHAPRHPDDHGHHERGDWGERDNFDGAAGAPAASAPEYGRHAPADQAPYREPGPYEQGGYDGPGRYDQDARGQAPQPRRPYEDGPAHGGYGSQQQSYQPDLSPVPVPPPMSGVDVDGVPVVARASVDSQAERAAADAEAPAPPSVERTQVPPAPARLAPNPLPQNPPAAYGRSAPVPPAPVRPARDLPPQPAPEVRQPPTAPRSVPPPAMFGEMPRRAQAPHETGPAGRDAPVSPGPYGTSGAYPVARPQAVTASGSVPCPEEQRRAEERRRADERGRAVVEPRNETPSWTDTPLFAKAPTWSDTPIWNDTPDVGMGPDAGAAQEAGRDAAVSEPAGAAVTPEEAAKVSAAGQAAQAALAAARVARARAVQDDLAAVEAAYAAAVDAGGDLSEYPSRDGAEYHPPRLVPGGILPQRVPAAPDVPEVPGDEPEYDYVEQEPQPTPLASPELARIATHLRSDEEPEPETPERPDGFDMDAVLAAVREVEGVRDAQLRPNPNGVHTLRLDLADGADGARVSREVARLLKLRMGLAAEPRRPVAPAPRQAPTARAGQPRDAMPVAGAAPAPRIPIPASAAEHLGGPAAANVPGSVPASDERDREPQRRHPVSAGRARGAEGRGTVAGEHAQATPPLRRAARSGEGSRVVLDQVQVNTLGLDATVTVRLLSGRGPAEGRANGPAVDGYVLRLAAVAAASAIDQLLSTVDTWEQSPGRCFVEHAAMLPLGNCEVAVVVVLLVCGGWVEQLCGSALVNGDPRQAVVRATLAAVNRRLDGLLG